MAAAVPSPRPVALITGAARRLGRAIALELARRGADIALHYRASEADARQTQREIRALGARCETLAADLADPPAAQRLAGEAAGRLGRLDILVNSASVFYDTPLGAIEPEEIRRLLDLNLVSPLLVTQAAASWLVEARGCVINLLDEGALRPWKSHIPYIASKAGLAAATIGLAKALAPRVRVNGIAPGPVLLPEDSPPDEARRSAEATLLGRLGTPEAVARAAAWLAFEADYTTGEILHVDGGRRWMPGGRRP